MRFLVPDAAVFTGSVLCGWRLDEGDRSIGLDCCVDSCLRRLGVTDLCRSRLGSIACVTKWRERSSM